MYHYEGKVYTCELCEEEFTEEVWHCPVCAHHWLMTRTECHNCYDFTRDEENETSDR